MKPNIRCWKCEKPLAMKDVEWVTLPNGDMCAYCKECGSTNLEGEV